VRLRNDAREVQRWDDTELIALRAHCLFKTELRHRSGDSGGTAEDLRGLERGTVVVNLSADRHRGAENVLTPRAFSENALTQVRTQVRFSLHVFTSTWQSRRA
jgi:hypothetical protein